MCLYEAVCSAAWRQAVPSAMCCVNHHGDVLLQLKKLGVMPPEQPLPPKCYRIYQVMWANNGDTISRQYAGTAALKVPPRGPLAFLYSEYKKES